MKNVMNAIGVGLAAFLVLVGAASMAEARYVGHPVARHNVGRGYVGHPVARSVKGITGITAVIGATPTPLVIGATAATALANITIGRATLAPIPAGT